METSTDLEAVAYMVGEITEKVDQTSREMEKIKFLLQSIMDRIGYMYVDEPPNEPGLRM